MVTPFNIGPELGRHVASCDVVHGFVNIHSTALIDTFFICIVQVRSLLYCPLPLESYSPTPDYVISSGLYNIM